MGGEGSSLIIAILWPFYRLYQHAIKKKYPLFYVYIYTGSAGALLTKKRMKAFSQCKDFLLPFIAFSHFYQYRSDTRTEPQQEYPKDGYLESHLKYVLFFFLQSFSSLHQNRKTKQRSQEDPKLKKPLKSVPFPRPFTPPSQSSRGTSLTIFSSRMSRMRGQIRKGTRKKRDFF